MLKKVFAPFAILLTFCFQSAKAQSSLQQLKAIEDSLVVTVDSMYGAFIPDERAIYNEQFVKQLVRALKIKGSYEYPFNQLQTKINILYPDDKSFRMFNWSIAPTDVTRRYYGAIQMPGEDLKLYPLIDYTAKLGKNPQDSVLKDGKWYGAQYYRIMSHEADDRTVYTLFGLNGASPISNKKVLEPLTLTDKGPVFGAPIFTVPMETSRSGLVNRFIIEYKKEVQASMNWDKDRNAIYFDRLVSQVNDPNRKYTYVPSGEYDGFRWEDGKWRFVSNLIPVDIREDGQAPAEAPLKAKQE